MSMDKVTKFKTKIKLNLEKKRIRSNQQNLVNGGRRKQRNTAIKKYNITCLTDS